MAHLMTTPYLAPNTAARKQKVAYLYDNDIAHYDYEPGHPMKPHRIRMTHDLVLSYGLYKKMEIYRAKPAVHQEMTRFHTDEYIDFLARVTPDNRGEYEKEQLIFNVGHDSPIFYGLFDFCSISAGGSMEGAARLNRNMCDIAINWAGGLHHAKKGEGSGFCYVNDIVLAILELLRYHKRVLYIDIDVHHGDGVEEAFYTTDRVMTVSAHKFGDFFPGTGELGDIGIGTGKHYAVNVPLRDGIDDKTYHSVFRPVIQCAVDHYQPDVIVLQCGADSLSGDRLGSFNLSLKGHGDCVEFVKGLGKPLLVLGGGGYSVRNVARAWAHETSILLDEKLDKTLPYNQFYEHYGPDYELDVKPSNMHNSNSKNYLDRIRTFALDSIKRTTFAPSVQMSDIPRDLVFDGDADDAERDADEDENKDTRHSAKSILQGARQDQPIGGSDSDDDIEPHEWKRPSKRPKLHDNAQFANGTSKPSASSLQRPASASGSESDVAPTADRRAVEETAVDGMSVDGDDGAAADVEDADKDSDAGSELRDAAPESDNGQMEVDAQPISNEAGNQAAEPTNTVASVEPVTKQEQNETTASSVNGAADTIANGSVADSSTGSVATVAAPASVVDAAHAAVDAKEPAADSNAMESVIEKIEEIPGTIGEATPGNVAEIPAAPASNSTPEVQVKTEPVVSTSEIDMSTAEEPEKT